jgi:hypothetical protein
MNFHPVQDLEYRIECEIQSIEKKIKGRRGIHFLRRERTKVDLLEATKDLLHDKFQDYESTYKICEGFFLTIQKYSENQPKSFSPRDSVKDCLYLCQEAYARSEQEGKVITRIILKTLQDKNITDYFNLFNIHFEQLDKPLKEELLKDLFGRLKYSDDSLRSSYWSKISYFKNAKFKQCFWEVAPQSEKRKELFRFAFQFYKSKHPDYALRISWRYAYNFNDLDWKLIEEWLSDLSVNDYDYNAAKMMSARGAEKLVYQFYSSLGYSVKDTSIHQVTGESRKWVNGDIELNNHILLDVKNARKAVNSSTHSEFYVKEFKQDRKNNVRVAAVLSPYIQKRFMDGSNEPSFYIDDPLFLGEFNETQFADLEKLFSSHLFVFDRGSVSKKYLPPWLFDYTERFYEEQYAVLEKFKSLPDVALPNWEKVLSLDLNPIPLFIAAKRPLPEEWVRHLPKWKVNFIETLITLDIAKFSLPYLFLGILSHFLKMLSYDGSDYSPNHYKEVLFFSNSSSSKPLKLYDPLNTVNDLCDALTKLWKHKERVNLANFKAFKFTGQGLLKGECPKTNRWTSILAYCGGKVPNKGICGYDRLIIGLDETCSSCGYLVCPKTDCRCCSHNCSAYQERRR